MAALMAPTAFGATITATADADVYLSSFHPVGDGAADDSAPVQSWLNAIGNGTKGVCETGIYRTTRPLTMTGNVSMGVQIAGPIGLSRGHGGCQIRYDGPSGKGAVLYLNGVNGSLLDNLDLDANNKALYAIQIDNSDGNHSSSGVQIEHSTFAGVAAGGVAIAIGHPGCISQQVSEVSIKDSFAQSYGVPGQGEGFQTFCGNNEKNFTLSHDSFVGWSIGVDWAQASGYMRIDSPVFGNTTVSDIKSGTGQLTVTGGESETANARFLTGGCGNNAGAANIIGFSWQSSAPSDDIVINFNCQLNLYGNDFRNYRTSSSVPKVFNGSTGMDNAITGYGGVISEGNFYQHAKGLAPIYDGSGNFVVDLVNSYPYAATGHPPAVISEGDQGGDGGGRVSLKPVHGWIGNAAVDAEQHPAVKAADSDGIRPPAKVARMHDHHALTRANPPPE